MPVHIHPVTQDNPMLSLALAFALAPSPAHASEFSALTAEELVARLDDQLEPVRGTHEDLVAQASVLHEKTVECDAVEWSTGTCDEVAAAVQAFSCRAAVNQLETVRIAVAFLAEEAAADATGALMAELEAELLILIDDLTNTAEMAEESGTYGSTAGALYFLDMYVRTVWDMLKQFDKTPKELLQEAEDRDGKDYDGDGWIGNPAKKKKAGKEGTKDNGIIWAPPDWEEYVADPVQPYGLALNSAADLLTLDVIAAVEAGMGEGLFVDLEYIRSDLVITEE